MFLIYEKILHTLCDIFHLLFNNLLLASVLNELIRVTSVVSDDFPCKLRGNLESLSNISHSWFMNPPKVNDGEQVLR